VGVDTIIYAIFLVVAFLGWIINQINGQNNPQRAGNPRVPPPQQRPPRPAQDRLQNEIEVFLREVQGRKPQAPPPPGQEQREPLPVNEPLLPAGEPMQKRPPRPAGRPRPPARRQRPGDVPGQAGRGEAPQPQRAAPVGASSKNMSAELKARLEEHMRGGVAERHLESKIDESVSQHLQHISSNIATTEATPGTVSLSASAPAGVPIRDLLRNPTSMRQAILLNEILSRPRGRRTRS
jgi:hypothetical protein